MRFWAKDFPAGSEVLIYRQTTKGIGYNKMIVVGEKWSLPKPGDDDFQKILDKQAEEYFREKDKIK